MSDVIHGRAIVFDRPSETLGFFVERIAPEAVVRTLRDKLDLRALVDHDATRILGRMSAGTLRVEKDARGLLVEIDPPETTSGRDIVESIRRRDVQGMSFAFSLIRDTWDATDPPTRTIHDMVIREVSICTFPAYPQTEVALRSLREPEGPRTVTERLRWTAETLQMSRAANGAMVMARPDPAGVPGGARSASAGHAPAGMTADTQEGQRMELAMVRTPDGTSVPRLEARRSYERFQQGLRALGGRAPRGKVWCSQQLRWIDRAAVPPTSGLSLKEAQQKQDEVSRRLAAEARASDVISAMERRLHATRAARLAQERTDGERQEREAVDAYVKASEDAIRFMRMYIVGRSRPARMSLAEAQGYHLALSFPHGPGLMAENARRYRLARERERAWS